MLRCAVLFTWLPCNFEAMAAAIAPVQTLYVPVQNGLKLTAATPLALFMWRCTAPSGWLLEPGTAASPWYAPREYLAWCARVLHIQLVCSQQGGLAVRRLAFRCDAGQGAWINTRAAFSTAAEGAKGLRRASLQMLCL